MERETADGSLVRVNGPSYNGPIVLAPNGFRKVGVGG